MISHSNHASSSFLLRNSSLHPLNRLEHTFEWFYFNWLRLGTSCRFPFPYSPFVAAKSKLFFFLAAVWIGFNHNNQFIPSIPEPKYWEASSIWPLLALADGLGRQRLIPFTLRTPKQTLDQPKASKLSEQIETTSSSANTHLWVCS